MYNNRRITIMKTIYDLKLLEETFFSNKLSVQRVPGGWIFKYPDTEIQPVFVPHSNKFELFQEGEYTLPKIERLLQQNDIQKFIKFCKDYNLNLMNFIKPYNPKPKKKYPLPQLSCKYREKLSFGTCIPQVSSSRLSANRVYEIEGTPCITASSLVVYLEGCKWLPTVWIVPTVKEIFSAKLNYINFADKFFAFRGIRLFTDPSYLKTSVGQIRGATFGNGSHYTLDIQNEQIERTEMISNYYPELTFITDIHLKIIYAWRRARRNIFQIILGLTLIEAMEYIKMRNRRFCDLDNIDFKGLKYDSEGNGLKWNLEYSKEDKIEIVKSLFEKVRYFIKNPERYEKQIQRAKKYKETGIL